jgi:outer membrane protein assembly factor BamD
MRRFLAVLLLAGLVFSCSPYQDALKSEDMAVKFNEATRQYEKENYAKAIRLFEQMSSTYRGKPQAEKMYYMYAMSYYKTKQYYSAGYQFESFVSGYPKSEKIEESAYLGAKSYAMLSPVYSLDQIDTFKAIEKLQAFIDRYPDSPYLAEANATVKELREKIEKKVFENAKGYNTISDYKSAIVALDNFIADYPGTPYKEEALYYKLDSAYKLAINSVPARMEERLNNAKLAYTKLVQFKGDTKFKEDADEMLARIDKDLQQYNK